jgi:ribonuclease HII
MTGKAPKTAELNHERALWQQGYRFVAGLDEAGRGAWAGPVVAGMVCLSPNQPDLLDVLAGVRDSKQLTPRARFDLYDRITQTAIAWGIGWANNREIDRFGIVPATCTAMARAIDNAGLLFAEFQPDFLLLDSIRWPALDEYQMPHLALIRGDQLSLSIAAASVLAKVYRDNVMGDLSLLYPEYGFGIHKGYGVAAHQQALRDFGPTPLHRMSFAPLRGYAQPVDPDDDPAEDAR